MGCYVQELFCQHYRERLHKAEVFLLAMDMFGKGRGSNQ
jgi:hypothetical protein